MQVLLVRLKMKTADQISLKEAIFIIESNRTLKELLEDQERLRIRKYKERKEKIRRISIIRKFMHKYE